MTDTQICITRIAEIVVDGLSALFDFITGKRR